jgi:hypothetical protein
MLNERDLKPKILQQRKWRSDPGFAYETGVWKRTRCIYWSPKQPPEDLKAQLLVSLLQLRLLPNDSRLVDWLGRYLWKNFRIEGQDRRAVADSSASHIIMHWGWHEDFRA